MLFKPRRRAPISYLPIPITHLKVVQFFKVVGSTRRDEVPKNAYLIGSNHPFPILFNGQNFSPLAIPSDGLGGESQHIRDFLNREEIEIDFPVSRSHCPRLSTPSGGSLPGVPVVFIRR